VDGKLDEILDGDEASKCDRSEISCQMDAGVHLSLTFAEGVALVSTASMIGASIKHRDRGMNHLSCLIR